MLLTFRRHKLPLSSRSKSVSVYIQRFMIRKKSWEKTFGAGTLSGPIRTVDQEDGVTHSLKGHRVH
jgi:hypothetical protein